MHSCSILLKPQIRILHHHWPQKAFNHCSVRISGNRFRHSILILEEICRTISTLSSLRIFRWAPLPGRWVTEPSSSKRPTKLLIMKAVGADIELIFRRYLRCVITIDR
ncbi:hypothetical protein TNIN_259111 [Trichonephila inaurata madagascariensis]|uniref:Uncharacterized protein n=1 Tax=Trichonephila inaurata madagascariensis TaxID=2747483 RepID=A0A8X6JZE7_9ARAC|nr:hypothetical protein TNIN_259111 [Trichonephila inaurata madagascariensis]